MKILLTGSSGFLGKTVLHAFKENEIITLSGSQSTINIDLSKQIPVLPIINMVIHCAGKAHSVPKSDADKKAFFDVNVTGTSRLLQGINRDHLPDFFVFVSSVAVYGRDTGVFIKENDPLLAVDPYGKSKIEAEQMIRDWCIKNKVIYTILRLPLLAGPNPPGNLQAMIKAIKKGFYFNIAGGRAKKSMVLTKDVAAIIPVAANNGGIYNLTDGYHPSFYELSELISRQTTQKKIFNLPLPAARLAALAGDVLGNKFPINSSRLQKIISPLTFDDSLARRELGWNPTPVLTGFKI